MIIALGNNNAILCFMLSYAECSEEINAMFQFMEEKGASINKPGFTLISDRGSAILSSLSGRFTHVKHHCCSKHLERNLKTHGWTKHLGLFWAARNAVTRAQYVDAMNNIRIASIPMHEYLMSIPNWALFELIEATPSHMIFGMKSSNIVEGIITRVSYI